MRYRSSLLVPLLIVSASAAPPEPGIDAPAVIAVTDEVVATDVPAIGANLTTIAGGTNLAINNYVWSSGFEPIVWRKFVRVERAGPDWFEWDSLGGPGYFNLAWTGLGNGARVRVYRIVDASGNPLSYAGGTDMSDVTGANRVVFVGETTIPPPSKRLPGGGYIANDARDGDAANDMDRVYVSDPKLGLRFGDYVYMKLRTHAIGAGASPPDLRKHYRGHQPLLTSTNGRNWRGELVPHPLPIPAAFEAHGETCLKVTLPEDRIVRLGQFVYHRYDSREGQWYSQLHPGARYRVSVWMRQEGLGNGGRVRFTFDKSRTYRQVSQTGGWVVTGDWQQFTYDFVAPPYPVEDHHLSHDLEFTGPGTVWIDDFVLYRTDGTDGEAGGRPFTPNELSLAAFLKSMPPTGRRPALRFYHTLYHPSSVEAMFTDYSDSGWSVAWAMAPARASGMTLAQGLTWALATGDRPETRVVPYLTLLEEYTEEEFEAVVEFLGVPYDPDTDTPATKPHAYARYRYRGHGEPWTDAFREIVIEYGNETWHNGAGGYGWDGWGRPGAVHRGGLEYGLFARFMFDEHAMRMPAWKRYRLGDKIKLALGANYQTTISSYGELAVQQGASIAYLGHADYAGPKWETGDTGSRVFDDHGVQETLIGRVTGIGTVIEGAARARDALRERGIRYELTAYEGGPSAYWQNKDDPEIDERYGKSAAMGLAALDAWLYASLHGFKHQCYNAFQSGKWWTSHTPPEAGGFRPHAAWLALTLRNRYVIGDDMVAVQVRSGPTLQRRGARIPLVAAYAFTNGTDWSVFVLNRKLDGKHDGHDFGDGRTPVTLELPFEGAKKVTLYKLARPDGSAADPRDNNRESLEVTIVSEPLDPERIGSRLVIDEETGGGAGGIPPGGMFLYVFERS